MSQALKEAREGALGISEDKFLAEVEASSVSQKQISLENDPCGWSKESNGVTIRRGATGHFWPWLNFALPSARRQSLEGLHRGAP